MSGVDFDGTSIRKGAPDTMIEFLQNEGGSVPPDLIDMVDRIARGGGTPLVVTRNDLRPGCDPPQGYRQRRAERALCPDAQDGHQDGHDHRR